MFLQTAGIVLLCPLLLALSVPDERDYSKLGSRIQIIKSPGTFEEAKKTCEHISDGSWQLPLPKQSEMEWHRHLITEMETGNDDEIWLALIKKRLPGWKNIDDSMYDGRVQENGDVRKTCGLVKLRYEAAVSDFCESSGYGYICQINNCTTCPPDTSPHNCMIMGEKCYILGCDAGSWFEASNRCVAMGTTLATLRSEDEVVRLVRMIKRRPNNPCQHFWVGILKAKWSFQYSQGEESPRQYYWYTGHPVPGVNCATLRKYDVGYYWASTDCQARHEFLCIKETTERSTETLMNVSSSKENISDESSSVNVLGTQQQQNGTGFVDDFSIQMNLSLLIVTVVMLVIILVITLVQTIIHTKGAISGRKKLLQYSAGNTLPLLRPSEVKQHPSVV